MITPANKFFKVQWTSGHFHFVAFVNKAALVGHPHGYQKYSDCVAATLTLEYLLVCIHTMYLYLL